MASALSDRRRNLGPTDLAPFTVLTERSNDLSTRIRPVFVSQGISAHASGSSYYETGGLKVFASVDGPRQLRGEFNHKAEVEVNVTIAEFSGITLKDDVSQAVADFVRSSVLPAIVLKEYPKSRIVISLTILNGETLAPLLAASVNAVVMALVNGGIALHDMVTSVSTALLENSEEVYVDSEFSASSSQKLKQLAVSYSISQSKITSMLTTSQTDVSRDDLQALLDRASAAAVELRDVLNSFLLEDYAKKAPA